VGIHDGDGAISAAEGTSFGNLQHADGGVKTFPIGMTIAERHSQRREVEAGQYKVCAKLRCMLRTQRGVDTAENNPGVRLKPANVLDNFSYAEIPVRHHGLNQHQVEGLAKKNTVKLVT
jgi:hypothetical protein